MEKQNTLGNILGVFGQDGIKTDLTVSLEDSSYVKLGATFIVTFVLCLLMWVMFKQITQK